MGGIELGKKRIFVSLELGEFFRKTRQEKGLSQLEVSAETGVHQGMISNIERGAYQAEPTRLERLCNFYGLDFNNLSQYVTKKSLGDELDKKLQLIAIEHDIVLADKGFKRLLDFEEMQKIEKGKDDAIFAVTYHLKGKYYERKKELNKALEYYELSVKYVDLHPELLSTNIKAASYNALARVCNRLNHLNQALDYIQKGLDSFVENGNRPHVKAQLLITKAIVLEKQDRDGEALRIIESIWDQKDFLKGGSARLNITQIRVELLNKMKRYDEAIEYALADLHDARLNRLYDRCFELWSSLGESYSKLGYVSNAELCYQTALNHEEKIKSKHLTITTYTQLGLLYLKQGLMELAYDTLKEAVKRGRDNNDSYRLVKALMAMSNYYLVQKQDLIALEHLEEALSLADKHAFDVLEFNILLKCSEISERNKLSVSKKYIDGFRKSAVKLLNRGEGEIMQQVIIGNKVVSDPPEDE